MDDNLNQQPVNPTSGQMPPPAALPPVPVSAQDVSPSPVMQQPAFAGNVPPPPMPPVQPPIVDTAPPVVSQPPHDESIITKQGMLVIGLAAAVLLALLGIVIYKNVYAPNQDYQVQVVPTVTPTPTEIQVPPIEDEQGLDGALQQIDSQNEAALETDISGNTQDATTFSE